MHPVRAVNCRQRKAPATPERACCILLSLLLLLQPCVLYPSAGAAQFDPTHKSVVHLESWLEKAVVAPSVIACCTADVNERRARARTRVCVYVCVRLAAAAPQELQSVKCMGMGTVRASVPVNAPGVAGEAREC